MLHHIDFKSYGTTFLLFIIIVIIISFCWNIFALDSVINQRGRNNRKKIFYFTIFNSKKIFTRDGWMERFGLEFDLFEYFLKKLNFEGLNNFTLKKFWNFFKIFYFKFGSLETFNLLKSKAYPRKIWIKNQKNSHHIFKQLSILIEINHLTSLDNNNIYYK